MARRIVIVEGHPDPASGHYCHALAEAYAEGAAAAGHEVRRIAVARLELPPLRTKADWDHGVPAPAALDCQADIAWADHLVIVYPLWLGTMPAVLKAFFEHVMRPGFAVARTGESAAYRKLLSGRSARIVVTMGMPALAYRWWFGAHSLKSLERNILRFVGIGPIRESLIGMVEAGSQARHVKWLARLRDCGARGA